MEPWMGALMDNLEVLTQGQEGGSWGRAATQDLLRHRIKIRSLNFMRGRTFLNRYLILDEAQNLTSKQMKALVTRAGPGHQARLPRQHRADRHALPHRDDLGPHLRRQPLSRLAARRPRHAGARRALAPRRFRLGSALSAGRRTMRCRPRSNRQFPPGTRSMRALALHADAAARRRPSAGRRADDGSELPDIGTPASTTLSLADEYKIGLMIVRSLREAGQIVEDPEINEYLQALGMRLVEPGARGCAPLHFLRRAGLEHQRLRAARADSSASTPGLVTATRSEAELAGVLAHEIAHVTQRHIARSLQNAGRAQPRVGGRHARGDPDRCDHRRAERRGARRRDRGPGPRGAEPDQLHARQRGGGRPRRHRHPRRIRLRPGRDARILRHDAAAVGRRRPEHPGHSCAPTRSPASASPKPATARAGWSGRGRRTARATR